MESEVLTVQEVADALKLPKRTVYALIAKGTLVAQTVAGMRLYRIYRHDFEQFLHDHMKPVPTVGKSVGEPEDFLAHSKGFYARYAHPQFPHSGEVS